MQWLGGQRAGTEAHIAQMCLSHMDKDRVCEKESHCIPFSLCQHTVEARGGLHLPDSERLGGSPC